MAYVITDLCRGVCDTACVKVCPMDCIHGPLPLERIRAMTPQEKQLADVQMYINPDECIDCGACLPACPVSAIYHEEDLPEDERGAAEENRSFFEER